MLILARLDDLWAATTNAKDKRAATIKARSTARRHTVASGSASKRRTTDKALSSARLHAMGIVLVSGEESMPRNYQTLRQVHAEISSKFPSANSSGDSKRNLQNCSQQKRMQRSMLGNGQLSVLPGFRFHPTDEELLYYYLRKKVSYEVIDLDVIREVDLNKLEPWDLQEKCRIGSGPQNEWYFFSHKDKKYPTGTRTNRATAAGFWKATGRDKTIHLSCKNSSSSPMAKRIGMRKTLVFYTGRAPHGQKTDWIMHEYRLDECHDDNNAAQILHHQLSLREDGWVVCRVFEKKTTSQNRAIGHLREYALPDDQEHYFCGGADHLIKASSSTTIGGSSALILEPKQNLQHALCESNFVGGYSSPSSMHLPQLLSLDHLHHYHHQSTPLVNLHSSFFSPAAISPFNNMDIECSQNLLRLTSLGDNCTTLQQQHKLERTTFNSADWSFLDKILLASNQNQLEDQNRGHTSSQSTIDVGGSFFSNIRTPI